MTNTNSEYVFRGGDGDDYLSNRGREGVFVNAGVLVNAKYSEPTSNTYTTYTTFKYVINKLRSIQCI